MKRLDANVWFVNVRIIRTVKVKFSFFDAINVGRICRINVLIWQMW